MNFILDAVEARVLGCLLEKEMATPEYYPLSLNALINACNQKTNRYPVVSLDEARVAKALQALKEKRLAGQSDSGRVIKYRHDFIKHNNLIRREAALICLLLLRGPQTAGELRSRTERLCTFETPQEVLQYLENLADLGFVRKLPRQAGQKEQRFVHLLSGEPDSIEQAPVPETVENGDDRLAELERTVQMMQEEIEALKNEFLSFKKAFE